MVGNKISTLVAVLHVTCAALLCSASLAAEPAGQDAVTAWARQFAGVESGEIIWDAERLSPRPDRKSYEELRGDVFIRFRWPDCLDMQFGRPRGAADAPLQRHDPFTDRVVWAGGTMTEFSAQGRKSVRRRPATFSLRDNRLVFLDGAPLLAGKWLHEVGLPQGLATVTEAKHGTFRVDIPSFQIRLTLVPSDGSGASSLVLGVVEDLAQSGKVETTFEYTNFGVPKDCAAAVGYRRHVTLAPSSVTKADDMPSLPLERDDFVLEVKVLRRLSDKDFEVSTAGFTDLSKPRQLPGQIPDEQPRETPAKQSDHTGASTGLGSGWLPGVGVGLIIAAGFLFARSSFRPTS